jgi:ferredoxin
VIDGERLPASLLDNAKRAAQACPTFALRVEAERARD